MNSNATIIDTIYDEIMVDYDRIINFLKKKNANLSYDAVIPQELEYPYDIKILGKTALGIHFEKILASDNALCGFLWQAEVYYFGYPDGDSINARYLPGGDTSYTITKYEPKPLGFLFPDFIKQLTNKPKNITLYQGKWLSLRLLGIINPDERLRNDGYNYILRGYLAFHADLNNKFLQPLFKSLKAKSKESQKWVLQNIMVSSWLEETPPSFFYTENTIDAKNAMPEGIYKLPSGRYIYIPDEKYYSTQLKEFQKFLTTGEKENLKPNQIVFVDNKSKVLTATSTNNSLDSFNLTGLVPITTIDQKNYLDKPASFITSRKGSGLAADYPWVISQEGKAILPELLNTPEFRAGSTPIYKFIENPGYKRIFEYIRNIGDAKYGQITILNWLTFMGSSSLLYSCVGKSKQIIEDVVQKQKEFDSVSAKDMPNIACMKEGMIAFPHQAEAVAKLNLAKDIAILDIATGGGKTLSLILDILNLLQIGKIKRPLLCMPNALLGQWIKEVKSFTDNQVNVIPITTEIINKYGEDKLSQLCSSAPLNTIFITTYAFIRGKAEITGEDFEGETVYNFPSAQWIIDNVQPDYFALDEAHFIKNTASQTNRAARYIGGTVPCRRIATGTLITNTPIDLVGQLQFLDPAIVGNEIEFAERYAIEGNTSLGWRENFAEQIRTHLRENTSYIMYRNKDWGALLPKIVYSYNFVDLTPAQAKLYAGLVQDVLNDIYKDPILKNAWIRMQESEDTLEQIPAQLLGKLAKLEQFLTAPDMQALMKYASDENAVSCKINKIDELIDASLKSPGPNNKVIVAVHYKKAAEHLMAHSRHSKVSLYYDASKKENIIKFQTDPKVKVLWAVIQSLTEGLNLQQANRIIIADVDWTPGKLKQLEARIFRPHMSVKDKKIQNFNKDKIVYIDTVIANNSADTVKFAFQTYKNIMNAKIMESCPVEIPPAPIFSKDTLTARFDSDWIKGPQIMDATKQYNTWMQAEIVNRAKQGKLELQPIKVIKNGGKIGTATLENIPWVAGGIDVREGEELLFDYLANFGYSEDQDLTKFKSELSNLPVRTEYGIGTIIGVYKNSVRVKVNGTSYSCGADVVVHIMNKDEEDEPATTQKPNIEIYPGTYNDIPCLVAYMDENEEDKGQLLDYGFDWMEEYWAFEVTSKVVGNRVLTNLQSKFQIPVRNLKECQQFLNELTKGVYPASFPEEGVRNFLRLNKRKAPKDTLRVYPLVIDTILYFVVDVETHPGVNLTKYKFYKEYGFYIYLAKQPNHIKVVWKKLTKDFNIINKKDAIQAAKESFKFSLT